MFLNCPFIKYLTLQKNTFFAGVLLFPIRCYIYIFSRKTKEILFSRKTKRPPLHLLHSRRDFGERMLSALSIFLSLPFFYFYNIRELGMRRNFYEGGERRLKERRMEGMGQ